MFSFRSHQWCGDFPIHVGLEARILLQEVPTNYFDLLEAVMATIYLFVQKKGHSPSEFSKF